MAASGPITITTPLGPDVLVFRSMSGSEGLGLPFEYVVDLVSENANVKLTDLLGQTMTVHLELTSGEQRHFHGYVTSADFVESLGRATVYRAVLRPWLWLLNHTTNCRIFQNKSIPQIVKQIFRDHGFTDFEDSLHEPYAPAEYVVQYRESDFNFVSRLLEHVGIYYYFRHAASSHTLVLADSPSAHKRTPGCEKLPYRSPDEHRTRLSEYIDSWQLRQEMTAGRVALFDFDFEKPRAHLSAIVSSPKEHARADFEDYDYPGGYRARGEGQTRARVRLEQLQAGYARAAGHTNSRAMLAGALFELLDHPRDDQNKEYLVAFERVSLTGHELLSGRGPSEFTFSCDFDAIDSKFPFRALPTARKPLIEGPQTAMVVGSGEIWTDQYGRVKVQFHWDRDGKHDVSSSCWVRVSQSWAGPGWGSMHVPHIGQEVIVSFLEGDPDRPIVTGRVYDGSNMPWKALPGDQKKSYFRDEGANHIMMDATKGKERIELSTPYAKTKLALGAPNSPEAGINMETDQNFKETIGGDKASDTTGKSVETIGGDHKLLVDGEGEIKYIKNYTEKFQANVNTTTQGFVKAVVGSFKNELTIGEDVGVFVGFKHESFLGIKTELAKSKSFKCVYAKEVGKNYAELEEWAEGRVRKKSEKSYAIDVGEDGGMVHLDTETAIVLAGDISIRVDGKTKKIIIKGGDEIRIKAKKVKVTAEDGMTLHSNNSKIEGGPVEIASNLKVIP